jgi:hypothetical protein
MTGIQALERTMPDIPMKPERSVKREFEYIRHGTQTLIASFNVATGAIDLATVGDTKGRSKTLSLMSVICWLNRLMRLNII